MEGNFGLDNPVQDEKCPLSSREREKLSFYPCKNIVEETFDEGTRVRERKYVCLGNFVCASFPTHKFLSPEKLLCCFKHLNPGCLFS